MLREHLGYAERVPILEALRETIAWERRSRPEADPVPRDYAAEDAVLSTLSVER